MSWRPTHSVRNAPYSMRDNYAQGVDVYYKKVGGTYRNLHFRGLRLLLLQCLSHFWDHDEKFKSHGLHVIDLACGSGEVSETVIEWEHLGRELGIHGGAFKVRKEISIRSIPPELPPFELIATDPFTLEAYTNRIGKPCLTLNFQDIADEKLPPSSAEDGIYDLVICSFALHLLTEPSKLFSTCYALSVQCRWLLVLGPHKKPELKPEWGWDAWNIDTWCPLGYGISHDYVLERVHARFFKSRNLIDG
ncbi:hypothetical protein POMI540_1333 [Schizosaccharomyces pombe]|uniref:Uncharacterized protein C17A5.05c n=1 Tax=Schizosaccharomyces pombe (strain 972 / ATCC 24843) TaxID=284812 RepID=YE95_SCHPO|nr:uncharacterized protein SPAC17A5.05c [Schizosaccharomyces pombe]O13767.1 RecName: Full=Uncharacterized protein C17A5.05c [Schizosaccharomyces pombe 972h-]CAB11505.1 conserved fungal protein [Schizosaccharomyces pombe]|eukprot:NP_593473.1 uncharacterized protein SPAC17A5.05c [Schizosaccharomyces pombe]